MFLLSRSNAEKSAFCGIALAALSLSPVAAQVEIMPCPTCPGEAPVAQAAPVPPMAHVSAAPPVRYPDGTYAPPRAVVGHPDGDRLDNDTLLRRGVAIGVGGSAAAYGAGKVSKVVRNSANIRQVKDVGPLGKSVAAVPIFGKAAARGSIVPTTLGQVPVMGYAVKRVPVVGPVIAGPADPIIVGAVAVDNYVLPKYSPCGYTKSSIVAATNDFNTPPRLRSYVNYLAPLPSTHPPIYERGTLNTDLLPNMAYIDAIPDHVLSDAVSVPDL